MKVVMPKMGMNMEEGTIVEWKKKEGEYVRKGEVLLEIMSNKVNMDIEAVASGFLKILKRVDEVVPVGEPIALIEEAGPPPAVQEVPALPPREVERHEVPVRPEIEPEIPFRERIAASPRARMLAEEKKIPLEGIRGTGPGGVIVEKDVLDKIGEKVPTGGEPTPPVRGVAAPSPVPEGAPAPVPTSEPESYGAASPLAERIARERGVDLSKVKGTGIGGRISKEDVLSYLEQREREKEREREERMPPRPVVQPIPEPPPREPTPIPVPEREPIRVAPTPTPPPSAVLSREPVLPGEPTPESPPERELPITPVPFAPEPISRPPEGIELRGIRKLTAERMLKSKHEAPHLTLGMEVDMTEASRLKDSLNVTYTDIVVKAAASALKKHPMLNSTLKENRIILRDAVNIGIAVARGEDLIVPVITNADTLSLQELSRRTRDLIERTKRDQLTEKDVMDSTFTVTNLGMYDIDFFTPIINPPEAAILGVGRVEKKPVVVTDRVEVRLRATLSLSFDHRIVNGVPASLFLKEIRALLENPYRLLVEG